MCLRSLKPLWAHGGCCSQGREMSVGHFPASVLYPLLSSPKSPLDTHRKISATQSKLHMWWACPPCWHALRSLLPFFIDAAHLCSLLPHMNLCPCNAPELLRGCPAKPPLTTRLHLPFPTSLLLSSLLAADGPSLSCSHHYPQPRAFAFQLFSFRALASVTIQAPAPC